jgi:hypothetical protein
MDYTFEEAMEIYRKQSDLTRRLIRRFASQRLVYGGAEEVGSSDINHEVYAICREYNGDFEEAVMDFINLGEYAGIR